MSTSFASTSGSSTFSVIESASSKTSTAGVHAAVRPLSSRGAYASPKVLNSWSCNRNRSRNGSYRVMAMAVPPLKLKNEKPFVRRITDASAAAAGPSSGLPATRANVTSGGGRSRARNTDDVGPDLRGWKRGGG